MQPFLVSINWCYFWLGTYLIHISDCFSKPRSNGRFLSNHFKRAQTNGRICPLALFWVVFQNQGQMVDFYQTVSKGLRPTGGFVLLKQFDKNRNKDKKAKLAMYEIQK